MNKFLIAAATKIILSSAALAQVTNNYSGNGNGGFGGVVGQSPSNLQIVSQTDGTLNFSWTRGPADFNNALVFYIDSITGGFSNTASFNDQADSLRRAISGASGGNTGLDANARSIVAFNSGFTANYAIAMNTNFGGLWGLNTGGDNSLSFITGVGLTPTANPSASSYSWSLNVTNIGLTVNSGQSFKFVGTYLNADNSFRANEAFGFSISGGNPGAGGIGSYPTTTATSEFTFQTVPEPSTYALLALSAAALGGYVARRRRRG